MLLQQNLKNKGTYFLAFALFAILCNSCGVRRDNAVAKKYHNTTTYFNYLYNGEIKWQEGVNEINAAYRIPPEGYIEIIYSGDEKTAQTFATNFEQAIEKAEIALQKHYKEEEKERYKDEKHHLDDLRYLIGRSWFYKRNYFLAIKNFESVIKEYPDSKIIPDVYLWLVKTHYRDGNNLKALKLIDEQLNKLELKKRQKGEKALIQAQVLLDVGEYDEVVRILNRHKKNIKGKNNRARAYYLMGQIYSDQDNYAKAYEAFKKVTKINTDYELIFNAKLNIARNFIAQSGEADGTSSMVRYLKKMLRDEKNIDYKDQIYYEMAMIYYQQNSFPVAVENLKLSIANNTTNQRQKAISYYKTGQIYFYDLKDFTQAQLYFDSASTAINKDAPEYAEISSISATLKEYIGYVNTIETNDSLLALSRLSDTQLESRIDKILEEKEAREAEEQRVQLEELSRLNDPNLFGSIDNGGGRKSTFYFDEPDQITNGKIEFQQRWGTRRNEDNWRRKNKQAFAQQENTTTDTAVGVTDEDIEKYGSAEKAKMIKNVPRSDAQIAAAKQGIASSLYGLAQVYENKLFILDSAVANYKKLIRRYPDNEFSLKGSYALYRLYKDKYEMPGKATEVEQQICGRYPESRYCRMIKTGEMISEDNPEFENFTSAYTALVSTYQSKDYSTCVTFAGFIASQYPTVDEMAEVYYIKGKSYGFMGEKDSLKTSYEFIKLNYPQADVTPEVLRTLAYMNGEDPNEVNVNSGIPGNGDFLAVENDPRFKGFVAERKPQEKLFVIMLVNKEKLKSNELQQKLNEFNKKYYGEKRLNVSVFLYKNQYHLPYISQFQSENEALDFIRNAMKEPGLGELLTGENEKMVFLTPGNFRLSYGKKRFEDYFLFYENVVLKSLDGK